MTSNRLHRGLVLHRGQCSRIHAACGTSIDCRRGTLWITVDHDLRDIVLEAGESYVIAGSGSVLVSSVGGPASAALNRSGEAPCVNGPTRQPWWGRIVQAVVPPQPWPGTAT